MRFAGILAATLGLIGSTTALPEFDANPGKDPAPTPDPFGPDAPIRNNVKAAWKDINNPGEPRSRPLVERKTRRAKRWLKRRQRTAA